MNLIFIYSIRLLAVLASLAMFAWPLFVQVSLQSEINLAQSVFIALMPLIVILLLAEFSSGNLGSRQLAILGVLTALNAVVRMLGAGTGGIETAFFLIILGGFVFGSSFGFILGSTSLLVSALITGGVGPWLPFQMMAAALVGFGAGMLPRFAKTGLQISTLVAYAIFASFVYGSLMTLWNWPLIAGIGSDVSYLPAGGILENLTRFIRYEIVTGGLLWDAGRAITTVLLLLIAGPALLATLRRVASKAGFSKKALV